MDHDSLIFLERVLLSLFVGGGFIVLVTVAAERFGSTVGGVIGGIPSITAITLLFLGITASPLDAANMARAVPAGMACYGPFLVGVVLAARRFGMPASLAIGAVVWGLIAAALLLLVQPGLGLGFTLLFVSLVVSVSLLVRLLGRHGAPGGKVKFSGWELLVRAVLSGGVTACGVLLGRLAGPFWGALISSFPVVTLLTLAIAARSAGIDFARRMALPYLVSGGLNVSCYSALVVAFYPYYGVWWGTALCFVAVGCTSYFSMQILRRVLAS